MEFVEIQSAFDNKVIRYIAIALIFFWLLIFYDNFKDGLSLEITDTESFFGFLMPLFILVIWYIVKMRTIIDREGVTVSQFPYIIKRRYLWNDITKYAVREYSPDEKFASRIYTLVTNNSLFKKNYHPCLELFLKNGKEIIIGTGKPEEIRMFIKNLNLQNVKMSPLT